MSMKIDVFIVEVRCVFGNLRVYREDYEAREVDRMY